MTATLSMASHFASVMVRDETRLHRTLQLFLLTRRTITGRMIYSQSLNISQLAYGVYFFQMLSDI